MKKLTALALALIMLLALCPTAAVGATEDKDYIASFVLPKPEAPNYMNFISDPNKPEWSDELKVVNVFDRPVLELAAEYYADSDAFYEKYGLYSFQIGMQYDSSLDNLTDWKYTEEWDSYYSAPGTGTAACYAWIDAEMMEIVTIFDLYSCGDGNYKDLSEAISSVHHVGDYEWDTYHFDDVNHSLNIRRRYYMEWEMADDIGNVKSSFSEWSDVAVFGKNSTAIMPAKPTGYEAPVISDLKFVYDGTFGSLGYLTYMQITPKSAYEANIYYYLTDNGYYTGMETQISVNGSAWQEYKTVNSGGDWCLSDGLRTAWLETPVINAADQLKIRIRFVGSEGYSPWSNEATLNIKEIQRGSGDVNGDGKINSLDAAWMLRHDAEIITLNEKQLAEADVNADGRVNSLDAAWILRFDAGLIK